MQHIHIQSYIFLWNSANDVRLLKWLVQHFHIEIKCDVICPGPLFTKKTLSYGYRDHHDKHKTV